MKCFGNFFSAKQSIDLSVKLRTAKISRAQSVGTVEYADCICVE